MCTTSYKQIMMQHCLSLSKHTQKSTTQSALLQAHTQEYHTVCLTSGTHKILPQSVIFQVHSKYTVCHISSTHRMVKDSLSYFRKRHIQYVTPQCFISLTYTACHILYTHKMTAKSVMFDIYICIHIFFHIDHMNP